MKRLETTYKLPYHFLPLPQLLFGQMVKKVRYNLSKTLGGTFVVTHGLKRIINKKRPDGGNYSFTSGHTSAAFTAAAFIKIRYGYKAGIPAYLLASYVGWSRVNAKKHDYWDIIGGAIPASGESMSFYKTF